MKIHEQCHYLLCNKWPFSGRWLVSWKKCGRSIIGFPPRLKWFLKSWQSPTEKVTFLVVFWISLLQKKGHRSYFGRTWPCFLQKSRPKSLETTRSYTLPEAASLEVAKCALVLQMRIVPGSSAAKVCMSEGFKILSERFQWIHSGCFLWVSVMAKDQDMEVILGDSRDKGYLGSILGPVDF